MGNLLNRIRQHQSRPTVRRHHVKVQLLLLCTTFFPLVVGAQRTAQPALRVGIGTFLSQDRGWNYDDAIEVFAVLARNAGSIDVEAGVSFSKSFVGFSYPAVYPPLRRPYRDGFRARLGLRLPSKAQSPIAALVGTELVHNRTEGEARATTVAGAAGVGLNFGSERRGMIDLRYVRFVKRLGSSRGILPITLAWQL